MAFLLCRWLEHLVLIVGLCYGRDLEIDTWVRWWCGACGACGAYRRKISVHRLIVTAHKFSHLFLWWGVHVYSNEILWLLVSKCAKATVLSTSKGSADPLSYRWQQTMRDTENFPLCFLPHFKDLQFSDFLSYCFIAEDFLAVLDWAPGTSCRPIIFILFLSKVSS